MGTRTVRATFRVNGVLTTPTSAKLSDATGTYGVKRDDTSAVVVADGTDMTEESTGVYSHTFTYVDGVAYTAWVEFVHNGNTYWDEHDFPAVEADTSGEMTVSFTELQERIADDFFGQAPGNLSETNITRIVRCIKDGLHSVYIAHKWSFMWSIQTITTEADEDTYDLPTGFDAIPDRSLTYPADTGPYPPVRIVKESEIRRRRQAVEYSSYPTMAALVTATFSATVGSKRQIVFYPTPDGAYVLSAKMRMRATMIDVDNPYPIGGEVLAPVIIESCLAAAERTFRDTEEIHGEKFRELLALAIADDKDAASPATLGFDAGSYECQDRSCDPCGHIGVTVYIDDVLM